MVTTTGSVGQIEQYDSVARVGSTGREACAGQARINQVTKHS
jgi:hypothetical protein